MSRAWRILDLLNYEGSLTYSRGRLNATGTTVSSVSLADVAVMLVSDRVSISGALLHKLADYDAVLLVCDWKNTPVAALYPWSEHTRAGARQLAQANLPLPRRKQAWARIVKAKISGQAATLESLRRPGGDRLRQLAKAVRSGDPGNHEAHAARMYWPRLISDDFRRNTAGDDVINEAFNYAYTVLRGHGIRAVSAAGLSPTLGIHHRGRSNPFNLVDDIIEPFRPAVDFAVVNTLAEHHFPEQKAKHALVSASTQPYSHGGHSVSTTLRDLGQRIGQYVEAETATLAVPTWGGPPT